MLDGAPQLESGAALDGPARAQRPAPASGDAVRRGYARGEARNEQIRQGLEPLAPGKRPGAVTVAVIVCVALSDRERRAVAGGVSR